MCIHVAHYITAVITEDLVVSCSCEYNHYEIMKLITIINIAIPRYVEFNFKKFNNTFVRQRCVTKTGLRSLIDSSTSN